MEKTRMKRIMTVMAVLLVLAGLMAPMDAAATAIPNPTNTTLAAAITSTSGNQVQLTSGTGVSASSGSVVNTYLIIDDEVMPVLRANPSTSTTTWTVSRGAKGTLATTHASGAIVLIVSPSQVFDNFLRGSGCSPATQAMVPRIVVGAGMRGTKQVYWETCTGDLITGYKWKEMIPLADTTAMLTKIEAIPIGGVALSSLGAATTAANGTINLISIAVPVTIKATGLAVLNSATVGTDKWILALYDSQGNLLANTSTSGTTTSGANAFQEIAFTSPYLIPGPARYFLAVQGNGGTDGFRTVATGTYIDVLGDTRTGTFGTLPSLTVPTTLTASQAPIMYIY